MKKQFVLMIILSVFTGYSQSVISLQGCYDKARINYPLTKQKDLIEKTKDYNVTNVWLGYLPQITINGVATYQSDVTSLPITIPGMNIDKLTQDQYKVYADVTQAIYDGGIMSSQSDIHKSYAEVDDHKIEVELIKVKERVNQIYFGILLIDAQINQVNLLMEDLTSSILKLEAAYSNGTATKSDVDNLKAEFLKNELRKIELLSSKKSYLNTLGLFTNETLNESVKLEIPVENISESTYEINRPELSLLSAQKNLLNNQSGITDSKIIPKASLFFQGGYGKPALNMLKNDFEWYYTTGIRFSWSLSNLYTYSNESEINELAQSNIDAQSNTFLLNTKILASQQLEDIQKLKKTIEIDKQIIELRKSVKEASKAKLENGVITTSDYIRDLNAEDVAIQNLDLHRIQLLMTYYSNKITTGN